MGIKIGILSKSFESTWCGAKPKQYDPLRGYSTSTTFFCFSPSENTIFEISFVVVKIAFAKGILDIVFSPILTKNLPSKFFVAKPKRVTIRIKKVSATKKRITYCLSNIKENNLKKIYEKYL